MGGGKPAQLAPTTHAPKSGHLHTASSVLSVDLVSEDGSPAPVHLVGTKLNHSSVSTLFEARKDIGDSAVGGTIFVEAVIR